jgi:DNA-binding NarL/FixJ family response regulator
MRILLADDQTQVRFALRTLLERQPGVEVVGETVDAEGLLAGAQATHPNVVLLSWELPGLGLGSLSALRQGCHNLAVIALSGRPEARREALAAGANAFVSKTDPPERLLAVIEQCHAGSSVS